ncbi:HMG-box [Backusella circina FSU 941]|nr:HMG-box [Backusella circina FSU 941]
MQNISDNLEYSLQQFAAFTQAQMLSPSQSLSDEPLSSDDYTFPIMDPILSQPELHNEETPTRVIRPPNAYLLFNREMRKKLKNNNPGMTVGEISKEIGIRWRGLSQTDKSRYVHEANKLKETQKALHPNAMYIRRSREELRKAGQSSKGKKESLRFHPLQQQQQRKRHKREKHPTAPKHPLSAYMWYLTEVRPETMRHYPGSTVGQISKLCAERWNKMMEEERAPWMARAVSDKERYAREMQIYALQNDHIMGRGTRQKYRLAMSTADRGGDMYFDENQKQNCVNPTLLQQHNE